MKSIFIILLMFLGCGVNLDSRYNCIKPILNKEEIDEVCKPCKEFHNNSEGFLSFYINARKEENKDICFPYVGELDVLADFNFTESRSNVCSYRTKEELSALIISGFNMNGMMCATEEQEFYYDSSFNNPANSGGTCYCYDESQNTLRQVAINSLTPVE